MAQKVSYNFETKDIYHEAWYYFCKQFLPSKRNRLERIHVAFFPGHEGREIAVYDRLGIPRRNLWAIERDKAIAEHIEDQGWGINVFTGLDYEFFEQHGGRLHIVNLDYQGHLTDDVEYTLGLLAARKDLTSTGFTLGTNFLGKRESRETQLNLANTMSQLEWYNKSVGKLGYDESFRMVAEVGREMGLDHNERILDANGIRAIRHEALVTSLRNIIVSGSRGIFPPKDIMNYMEDQGVSPDLVARYRSATTFRELWNLLEHPLIVSADQLRLNLLYKALRGFGIEEDVHLVTGDYIANLIDDPQKRDIDMQVSGKYINDMGSPMLFDFFRISRPRVHPEWPVRFGYNSEDGFIATGRDTPRGRKVLIKEINRVGSKWTKVLATPERVFIGSSYKPSTKGAPLEKITRDEAVTLLEGQVNPEEILTCFSGFTLGDLQEIEREIYTQPEEPPGLPIISNRKELAEALGNIDFSGVSGSKSAHLRTLYDVELDNLPQLIATHTMGLLTGSSGKPVGEASHLPNKKKSKKTKLTPLEAAQALAVASGVGREAAMQIWGLTDYQLRGYRALATSERMDGLEAVRVMGATFVGPSRVGQLVTNLIHEHGSVETIPESVLDHHGLEQVD